MKKSLFILLIALLTLLAVVPGFAQSAPVTVNIFAPQDPNRNMATNAFSLELEQKFNVKFNWNGQDINLDDLINNASNSMDDSVRMQRAGQVALIINDVLPFIPLNVEQSVEPLNEKLVSGAPKDGDPILKNPTGEDHWIILYLLQGKLSPGPDAK